MDVSELDGAAMQMWRWRSKGTVYKGTEHAQHKALLMEELILICSRLN